MENPKEPLYRDEYVEACASANIPMDINLYKLRSSPKKVAAYKGKRRKYTVEKDVLIVNAYRW